MLIWTLAMLTKNPRVSKFNFDRVVENMQTVNRDLPVLLANQARNYFLDTFTLQGWSGDKWKEVQRRTPGTPAYKWPAKPKASSRSNPILIRTGKLRRAVRNSIREASVTRVRLVVDLVYAKRHNDGEDGMPKRKFMGNSPILMKMQRELIDQKIKTVWRK
jgi:hypothetical protein